MKVKIEREPGDSGMGPVEISQRLSVIREAMDVGGGTLVEASWRELVGIRDKFKKALNETRELQPNAGGESPNPLVQQTDAELQDAIDRIDRELDRRSAEGAPKDDSPRPSRRSGRQVFGSKQFRDGPEGPVFRDVHTGKVYRSFSNKDRLADYGERAEEPLRLNAGHIAMRAVTGAWPEEIAEEARAMSIGSDSGGGYLVPELVSREIIDLARAQSVLMRAGARTLLMDQGTIDLARIETDPTFQWKAENNSFSPYDLTLGRVRLTAKTVGTIIPLSEELYQDAANISDVLNMAIAGGLAAELDRVGLHGSGSGAEPQGIYGASGINTYDLSAVPSSYDFVSFAVDKVREDNHEPNAMIAHPRTYGQLDRLKEATTNSPLTPPRSYQGLQHYPTSNVRIDMDNLGSPTTASNTSNAFIGKFDEMLFGVRLGLQIYASRDGFDGTNNAFRNFQVLVRAVMRVDVALLRPAAFCVARDIQAA